MLLSDRKINPQPKQGKRIKDLGTLSKYRERFPRCQVCGSSQNIGSRINGGVHHIIYKKHGGGDVWENLITLCSSCHTEAHDSILERETIETIKRLWMDKEDQAKREGRILRNG